MRTTLDLDDDVLSSAKEIARRENKTAGQVLSELARHALVHGAHGARDPAPGSPATPTGFLPFPARGGVVTNELVDALREEGG